MNNLFKTIISFILDIKDKIVSLIPFKIVRVKKTDNSEKIDPSKTSIKIEETKTIEQNQLENNIPNTIVKVDQPEIAKIESQLQSPLLDELEVIEKIKIPKTLQVNKPNSIDDFMTVHTEENEKNLKILVTLNQKDNNWFAINTLESRINIGQFLTPIFYAPKVENSIAKLLNLSEDKAIACQISILATVTRTLISEKRTVHKASSALYDRHSKKNPKRIIIHTITEVTNYIEENYKDSDIVLNSITIEVRQIDPEKYDSNLEKKLNKQ